MLKARWNNSLLELVSCRCVFFLRHGYMNAEKKNCDSSSLRDVLVCVKAARAPVRLSRDASRVDVPRLISAVN